MPTSLHHLNTEVLETRRPLWRRLLGWVGYGFFCLVLLVAGTAGGWIKRSPLVTSFVTGFFHRPDPAKVFGTHSTNILVLGCDDDVTEYSERVLLRQARSDMMLLVHFDFDSKRISALSIPRDTLCQVRGYRPQKINAYHAIGAKENPEEGKRLSKLAVETLLGVPVDRVLVLDFQEFQRLVDSVGGVDVFVNKHLKYDDNAGGLHIDIPEGNQHLDGNAAMGFVRFRHADDDFHRQARQHRFLMALKSAVQAHWWRLNEVADSAAKVIGNDLTDEQIVALAYFGKGLDGSKIKMGVIPTREAGGTDLAVVRRELPGVLADYGFRRGPEEVVFRTGRGFRRS